MGMKSLLIKDTPQHIGETVELYGWVDVRRDHGKLVFFDLRDFSAKLQAVVAPGNDALHAVAQTIRSEWALKVTGTIVERPAKLQNPNLPTGTVELQVTGIEVVSESVTPPFDVTTDGRDINEELRLKYRYLDLRRPRLQHHLRLRSQVLQHIRAFLVEKGFIEIETPMLTKSTPEGSRDFVVPSRLHPGKFYALPQSPQQYKQLLMVGGMERYFQIARAMRDEDTRADRGLEHTQMDLEMSFVEQKDIMGLIEELVISIAKLAGKKITTTPFPRVTYKESMEKYGADKFDARINKEDPDELAFAWVIDFPVFEKGEDGKWTYSHNPFTAPKPEDVKRFMEGADPATLTSLQYDLVCNGYEAGGGGIRIHDPAVLEKVFETIGHSKEKIQEQFGHMLEAFTFGVPPHGGIALGLDRLMMLLTGEAAMREVTAFPLTGDGRDPMMQSPSDISDAQKKELFIKTDIPKS